MAKIRQSKPEPKGVGHYLTIALVIITFFICDTTAANPLPILTTEPPQTNYIQIANQIFLFFAFPLLVNFYYPYIKKISFDFRISRSPQKSILRGLLSKSKSFFSITSKESP